MRWRKAIQHTVDRWRLLAGKAAPVALYHATFSNPPREIADGLHNVAPDILGEQMALLKRHFRFVSVDELAASRRGRGLAAVTFDDAYRCVLDEAFPVLESLDIPFTIYVNGCTLEGKALWRDKVRYLINHGLTADFQAQASHTQAMPDERFYRDTKEAPNNSRLVEAELDAFFDQHAIRLKSDTYYLQSADDFLRHPLVSYGNHTHDHYALTTLSPDEQRQQIERTHAALAAIPDINHSHLLSIPFGKRQHFDHVTERIACELGYCGLLLSRHLIPTRIERNTALLWVDRFMPDQRNMTQIFHETRLRKAA
ncbi:MAG: polysaccharide deacetylase family protein [Planctomycetales bacterium]|nr:polysaccharide deacetylase family protein [Planctomycetales bacterium]